MSAAGGGAVPVSVPSTWRPAAGAVPVSVPSTRRRPQRLGRVVIVLHEVTAVVERERLVAAETKRVHALAGRAPARPELPLARVPQLLLPRAARALQPEPAHLRRRARPRRRRARRHARAAAAPSPRPPPRPPRPAAVAVASDDESPVAEDPRRRCGPASRQSRCGNLSEIFDKVLTLHKMQSDEQRYEKEPVDLEADVLSHAVDYAHAAGRKPESAAFEARIDASLRALGGLVLASRLDLIQVLTNCLSNAFKFTPDRARRPHLARRARRRSTSSSRRPRA